MRYPCSKNKSGKIGFKFIFSLMIAFITCHLYHKIEEKMLFYLMYTISLYCLNSCLSLKETTMNDEIFNFQVIAVMVVSRHILIRITLTDIPVDISDDDLKITIHG